MLNQNIKVAADTMVFCKAGGETELLLIKRGNEPYKGMWALPGGFVEDNEDLEPAALRELEEETGMKLDKATQLHTFGKPGRDPRGRTVSVVYYAIVSSKPAVTGADDAADAQWVKVADIKEMAFDHMECLQLALRQLGDQLQA